MEESDEVQPNLHDMEDVEMADVPISEGSQETITPHRTHASETFRSRVRPREPSPSESENEEPIYKKRRIAANSSLTISTSMEDLSDPNELVLKMIRDLEPPTPTHCATQELADFFGRTDVPLLPLERFLTLSGSTIQVLFKRGFRLLDIEDFKGPPTKVKVGWTTAVGPGHCSAWAEILDGEFRVEADFRFVRSSHGPNEYWIVERARACLNQVDALYLLYSQLGF